MRQGTDYIIDCSSRYSRLIFNAVIKDSADASKYPVRILISRDDIEPVHNRILEHLNAHGANVEFRRSPTPPTRNFCINRSENKVSPYPTHDSDSRNLPECYFLKHIYGEEAHAIANLFENLWIGADLAYEDLLSRASRVRDTVEPANYWNDIFASITENPSNIFQMSPRKFEEMVAELLQRKGFETKITPPSKDGGRDVLAWSKTVAGRLLFLVECKKYSPQRPVGVSVVRALYGTVEEEKASKGLIVTSSYFTKGAIQFKDKVGYRLGLADYESLVAWIRSIGNMK